MTGQVADGTYKFADVGHLEQRRIEAERGHTSARSGKTTDDPKRRAGLGADRRKTAPRLVVAEDSWPVF